MAKVGVVVPVYNVKRYLRECLDSILAQTLEDIEVVCVDDGSTDGSEKILDEYAERDKRIKVIHKVNEGYGKAMNVGIAAISAPYVGIVESDDRIVPNMYEELYQVMEKEHADVIKADFWSFYYTEAGELVEEYTALATNDEMQELYNKKVDVLNNQLAMLMQKFTWSGMYNRAFLEENSIQHNETPGASYQDNGFWFQTMVKANSVIFLDRAYYKYRIDNPNSSMYSTGKVYAVCDEYDFVDKILDTMEERGKAFYKWSNFIRVRDCITNVHRVSEEYQMDLVKKARLDLLNAIKAGRIDSAIIGSYWRAKFFQLIVNPEAIVEEEREIVKKIQRATRSYDKIVIYGAGKIGNKVFSHLRKGRVNTKVQAFVVTNTEENKSHVLGVPVKSIYDIVDEKEETLVIIAVGRKLKDEVKTLVLDLGFENYILYSELM